MPEQAEKDIAIRGGEEYVPALIPALGDRVRALGNDDARESGHAVVVVREWRGSQKMRYSVRLSRILTRISPFCQWTLLHDDQFS